MTAILHSPQDVLYPETDGLPLSDNTKQFRLIMTTQGGLDALFRNEKVFVAGNLLWIPLQKNPDKEKSKAPDVMVVFGQNKGDRRSYRQWEEGNLGPQVTFEFVSINNTREEVEGEKLRFYQKHGVEEYYVHDPDKGTLKGWLRQDNQLRPIESMAGWTSPCLGIRFELIGKELQLYSPNGDRFATYPELMEQREQEQRLRVQAELRADQQQQRADQAESQLEQLSERLRTLGPEQLRALGIDPEQLR